MGAVGRCDIGRVRIQNEDCIYISENPDTEFEYYIVADGMGGHNAGEIASSSAIKYFNEYLSRQEIKEEADILDTFVEALSYSNMEIYKMSQNDSSMNGMGTTFTAAAVIGNKLYGLHVGDSRIYVYDKNGLKQLTKDHSFVMEMVRMGKLTIDEAIPADTVICTLEDDSIVLVCSDGLSTMITDDEIEKILKKKTDIGKKADLLVELANKNGGYDNISVILADRRVDN